MVSDAIHFLCPVLLSFTTPAQLCCDADPCSAPCKIPAKLFVVFLPFTCRLPYLEKNSTAIRLLTMCSPVCYLYLSTLSHTSFTITSFTTTLGQRASSFLISNFFAEDCKSSSVGTGSNVPVAVGRCFWRQRAFYHPLWMWRERKRFSTVD